MSAYNTHISLSFLQVTSVQMWRIFPPKDLQKYGAQNTHAPIFLQKYMFAQVISLLSINLISINLLSSYDITIYLLMKSQ